MNRDAPATGIHRPDPMIGTPGPDSLSWDGRQSYHDTCAIRCQEFVLQQFTNVDVDEHLLVREAMEHGWYTPGSGTKTEDLGKLLELHGIVVNRYENGASIFDLAFELAKGHKVIVAVDAKELKMGPLEALLEECLDRLLPEGANHAIVVSGIDTSNPNDIRVIVSDPGTGEALARIPLAQFVNAWRDSDFFMVATRDPAPPHLPEMAHFDYGVGHIPEIAGVSFEEFLTFSDRPEAWEQVVHHYVEVHHHIHVHGDLGAGAGPELETDAVADLDTSHAHDDDFLPHAEADDHTMPHSDLDSGTPDDQPQSDWT